MEDEEVMPPGDPHPHDAHTAVVLMAAAILATGVAVIASLVLMAGCAAVIHVQVEPAQVKPDDMVGPPAAFTTQDGDSKDAPISIPAQ